MAMHTAVIPAAGMGTRFLPATKAVPKELMPIFDTPALQIVMDEAIGAGCDHIVVVSSKAKSGIEAYLESSPEVVKRVRESGRAELADRLALIGTDVKISVVYQDAPRGLGHAVACARQAVGNESFAVLLPDELMGDASLLKQMCTMHDAGGKHVVGLKQVPMSEVSSYGCVTTTGAPDSQGVVTVTGVVEKPAIGEAPSDLILIGRYVLGADMFDMLDSLKPAAGGEILLTDALLMAATAGNLLGVVSDIERHDTGTPMGWLQAVIEIALKRNDVGAELSTWLEGRFK
ncbi:MAG: UTP--glucose-1-phosphate uridylyltransferase [Actinobacteria bacterium]|nr:MAG: UTP--glucose-1-phosphate uridylyltransferase [Actinomycetota bacterium]